MSQCQICSAEYEVTDFERALRLKAAPIVDGKNYDFPDSPFCPKCRSQRRCSFRNDRNLFKRKCSKTGKTILSTFREDAPFPVYSSEAWWGDEWDAKDYGQEYDFNRLFFDQFADLLNKTPRLSSIVIQSENCEYTLFSVRSRNCYLSSRVEGEDILYSYLAIKSNSSMDCYGIVDCELNYEGIDNLNCYNCIYTDMSKNCADVHFSSDMLGSKNCFGCVGLIHKEYHFFNEPLSKEEYEKKVAEYWGGSHEAAERCMAKLSELKDSLPKRNIISLNNEDCFGSYLFNSKNVWHSSEMANCEDAIHCYQSGMRDLCHSDFGYKSEMLYEQISCSESQRLAFGFGGYSNCEDLYYSVECANRCSNLFGCVSMKGAKYCILNKQYSKEEYEELLPKIIEHMKSTGEWGIYFKPELSWYPYNDTVAHTRFPLTEEQAKAGAWRWGETQEIPSPDTVAEGTNICPVSGRPFRHVKAELDLGAKLGIPPARLHPDVRHAKRLARRRSNPMRGTQCEKCQKSIWTDLGDEKHIYCEECFQNSAY
jgi:hypothetical protein